MRWKLLPLAVTLGLIGCSVGSGGSTKTLSDAMPEGTYQLSFAADTTAAAAPVGGVDLTVQLPTGVTVATTSDGTGQILATALTSGTALTGTSLMVGQFAPASGQAHLTLTTVATTAWTGEYARLKITVPANAAFTRENLLQSVSGSITGFKAVGLAGANLDTSTLTNAVTTSVTLVQ